MAIYRYIHVSFWEDTKVQDEMTPMDRYFMLYLLTNPHSSQVGVFEISKKQISNEIGYDVETVEKLLLKFENDLNIIKYDNSTKELMILNWYKYNWTTSSKVKSCIEKEMKKIKSEKFLDYLNRVCIPYMYPMDTDAQKKEKEKQKQKETENKNNKLNKIKLNSLYLFINKKNSEFEGLTEMDRQSLETTLSRLNLYIENDTYLPDEMKFDLQLKYYAISQIYLSPYKVYLIDLKEKVFTKLFLAAKQYCPIDNEDKIEDFMNYFIVCFRKEMEK